MNGAPAVGSPSKVAVTNASCGPRPSAIVYQRRSVASCAGIAAARPADGIRRALAARERIVVYGDYDVDGIAGSAILVRAFRHFGVAVGAYIPNRYEEGYGLNGAALRQLAADGTKVVISVDCGITAVAEAQLARQLGI